MRIGKYIITILLVWMAMAGEAALRRPDFNFMHINTENGLPSNRVRDIVQDEAGFMWFATDGGLVRYDGIQTKVFQPVNIKKNKDEVFVMRISPYRRGLLVGTDSGLYGYDSDQEKLALLPFKSENGVKNILGNVLSIAVGADESIWVSVDKEGVYHISPEGELITQYKFPNTDNYVSNVYVDSNDRAWAISNYGSGYLYRYDPKSGEFKEFLLTLNGEKRRINGFTLMQDSKGDYWLGTWEDGLIRFNGTTGEGTFYCREDEVPLLHVHTITEYSPDLLMVGSDSGLMLLEKDTGECCQYLYDELDPYGMSGQFVYPVTKDADGGIWIGTYYRGINYLGKNSTRFQNWHHSSYKNSVSGNVVTRLCEDEAGDIWVGTADGGLCRYTPATGSFRHYPLSGKDDSDNVHALHADGDKIWVGTYSNGAGYLDIATGKWHPVPVEGEKGYSCYAIYRDKRGDLWMGATQTFTKYNPEKNVFEKVSNLKSWINDIDEDNKGNIWISTQGSGLFKYNPETSKWNNYRNTSQPGDLPHDHINGVRVANGNQVYVMTPKGVHTYNYQTDGFSNLENFPEGVAANSIEKSGEDLWVASNVGLVMLKPDGKVRQFTTSDGLAENQFSQGSSLLASNGTLYFGNVYGFSGIDPKAANVTSNAPKVKFTGMNIVNEPIEVGDERLPMSLNSVKQLELDNSCHTFTIYFSALSYDNPEGNEYQYRLEGFDKTWHGPENDNSATYSNLPPGTYTLRVRAANSDGVWNDEGAALKIVVKPVWYMTAMMKLLYLIIALCVLLLIVRLILWRLEKDHNRELDRISHNKEAEMYKSKFSFFTVVAHEIRTPVSLIIGPLEKVMNSGEVFSEPVKSDLKVIDRNAKRLLALVNQLLDYKKVEDKALPVGFRHEKIVDQIKGIIDSFKPTLDQKNIQMTTDFPEPDMEVDVDPEAIIKLVSNLMNNAMKFTKDSISVKCAPIEGSDKFEIEIADNGIGIGKDNREKVFSPFFQVLDNVNEAKGGTGLGLSIVKSVVDAHNGEINLESEPGKGAKFTVILPMHQENVVPYEQPMTPMSNPSEEMSPDDNEPTEQEDPVLLVVDDNEEMVNFIASHFEKQYDVVTASDGQEALEKMKEKPVSLIICDWMMPVMDGEEFLRKVRGDENYSHIPFVMLTAKTDNESKITTMKSGADAYVEKPFSVGYLEARIGNLLEMRELLRKKYSKTPLEPLTTIAPTEVDNELLRKLQALIEENFSNPNLNVDFIADHLGISRSGLYAKIRSLADVTPNELIQITRLKKAAELLVENKYRVNEICYMVGFNSSSYFSRCFQKQFGMKPGEFASKK